MQTKSSKAFLEKIGLKTKILAVFVIVCSASLLSISLLSAGFFNVAAEASKQQSASALKLQIQRNMQKAAIENAGTISAKLESAAAQVELVAEQAKSIFDYPALYGFKQSYYHDLNATPTPPTPPARYFSADYGYMISKNVSCYLITTGNYSGLSYLKVSTKMNDTIRISASLDYLFTTIARTYPDFNLIYMGFQIGMFRCFPWHSYTPTYDPTVRTWYKTAKTSPGQIIFTNPYYGFSGAGLEISIARTVTMSNGSFVGVVSADVKINTIKTQITNIHLSPSGYAFLINAKGTVVAHPNSTAPTDTITSLDPAIPTSIITNMTKSISGFDSFMKNGKTHYIAYAPVPVCNYSVAVVVPEQEVIQSVDRLSNDINNATIAITVGNLLIIIIAAVLAILLGLLIANKMINPINTLVKYASRLSTMDLRKVSVRPEEFKIDAQLESQKDEIGDLTRAFKSMVFNLQKNKDKAKERND